MSLETDLYTLLQPLVGGTLIWGEQSKTLPTLPFTTMKISGRRMVNGDHHGAPNASGVETVKGDREFTLSMERHQAYSADSVTELLQNVANKLRLTTNIDKFMAKKIAVYDIGAVTDISALLDKTIIEKRAALDIFMRYKLTQTDTVGLIETVSVQSIPTTSATDTDSGAWIKVVDPTL